MHLFFTACKRGTAAKTGKTAVHGSDTDGVSRTQGTVHMFTLEQFTQRKLKVFCYSII